MHASNREYQYVFTIFFTFENVEWSESKSCAVISTTADCISHLLALPSSTPCFAEASVYQMLAVDLVHFGGEYALSTRTLALHRMHKMVDRKVAMFYSNAHV